MVSAPQRSEPAPEAASVSDPDGRRRLTDHLLDVLGPGYPLGSVARSQFLLHAVQAGYPTARSRAAYMENLGLILRGWPLRARPGALVIGMGTGRSGSTTLCHILSTCPESCATHENPPMLYWEPCPEQVAFHLDRFALLRRHFALVADTAHWWLNATFALARRFPDVRFVGIWRETDSCVESFLRIKGVGPGSLNHWLPPGTQGVQPTTWDPAYPSYACADPAADQAEAGKRRLIARYVTDYNDRMRRIAAGDPGRWLLLRTEELDDTAARRWLFAHAGLQGSAAPVRLNAGTVVDGDAAYRF